MKAPCHTARLLPSPWPEIHRTHILSERSFPRHWHATYGVGVIEAGGHRSASGRGPVDAVRGDLITTVPGEVHDGHPIDGQARRWQMVYLEPTMFERLAGDISGRPEVEVGFSAPVIDDARVRRALQRLFRRMDAWQEHSFGDGAVGHATQPWTERCPSRRFLVEPLACDEALIDFCVQLVERHVGCRPTPIGSGAMRRVRERLADDVSNPPSLAELAALSGLSRYQVLRRFEREYGLPPHAWLMQQRLERARRWIRAGSGLADAAVRSGFADQSHMTRDFARTFGYTPGAWRASAVR